MFTISVTVLNYVIGWTIVTWGFSFCHIQEFDTYSVVYDVSPEYYYILYQFIALKEVDYVLIVNLNPIYCNK